MIDWHGLGLFLVWAGVLGSAIVAASILYVVGRALWQAGDAPLIVVLLIAILSGLSIIIGAGLLHD